MNFSEHQRLLLEAICKHFHENGAWPTCGILDKALRHHTDLDVEDVLKELDSFMHDGWRAPLSGWDPNQIVVMNVRALHICQADGVFPDLEPDLVAFMALVLLCIERYRNGEEDILITEEESYNQAPELSHQSVDNAFQLILVENFCGQSSSGAGTWSFKVSDTIRKYRDVKTLEDYLAVRHKLLTKLVYTGLQSGVQPNNLLDRFASEYTLVAGNDADLVSSPPETQQAVANVVAPTDVSQSVGSADAVVPMELLQDTRGYVVKVARQVNRTYNAQCYDACAVMIRRLIETLIIEVFETRGIADHIKFPDGTYFRLDGLVSKTLAEASFSVGRNFKRDLPRVKETTDKSAHDRRINALASDIDRIRDAVRGIVEELVNLAKWK